MKAASNVFGGFFIGYSIASLPQSLSENLNSSP
jgi:hypothetical protein